ncbi:MATE family efflux transporter [Granulicatella seriolae]|uniref:Probable multidrug resistance protein NorM n=1 Tax=Granulicatella seriolae TaxID=2967226 RepID=A0ABT1WQ19_9LACT|nr:MATE family efflux transporter [Granulicatella seriolae]
MKTSNRFDLTQGSIIPTLIRLSMPLMATAFVQMAYNLTDIFWIGKMGVEQVAATGTIGYYIWLASSVVQIPRIGVSVLASQSFGKKDLAKVQRIVENGLQMALALSISYASFLYLARGPLIGFFHLSENVANYANEYLSIILLGMPFVFMNPILSTTYTSIGNSKTPFRINALGLLANILLDPILIFGLGPIPSLGVKGAALATSLANLLVTTLFLLTMRREYELLSRVRIQAKTDWELWKRMAKLGFPSSLQNSIHAFISILLTRLVAKSGSAAVAVYSTGSQIESINWLTTEGVSFALTAFVGQNYGARLKERTLTGIRLGLRLMISIGLVATILMVVGRNFWFTLFISDSQEALRLGAIYLLILAASQMFMSLEIGSTGIFHGVGETRAPSMVGIVFNLLRIPLALLLLPYYGAIGVWVAITISSIIKGIVNPILLKQFLKKKISWS